MILIRKRIHDIRIGQMIIFTFPIGEKPGGSGAFSSTILTAVDLSLAIRAENQGRIRRLFLALSKMSADRSFRHTKSNVNKPFPFHMDLHNPPGKCFAEAGTSSLISCATVVQNFV